MANKFVCCVAAGRRTDEGKNYKRSLVNLMVYIFISFTINKNSRKKNEQYMLCYHKKRS